MRGLLTLFSFVAILILSINIQAAELVDPAPVAIPGDLTSVQVATEIKRALIGRGWIVNREQPGKIEASLHIRTHVARVAIHYSESQVSLTYLSSDNLDYKEKKGKRMIHKNYLSWVNNIMQDIYKNMQNAVL